MTKAKHTPGPWRIVPYDAGDVSEWGIYTPMIDGSEEADRAVVHWAGFKQKYWQSADGNQKEIEANANLIAAAPDLLEALEGLVEEIDDCAQPSDWDHYEAARAAIAKAKGEVT